MGQENCSFCTFSWQTDCLVKR